MIVKNRIFASISLLFFGLVSYTALAGKPVDQAMEQEILETFAEYQDEVMSGSQHLARYFSKEANEFWLNWFLEEETVDGLLDTYRVVRNRASFGSRIREVYEYEVTRGENGDVVLSLIYKMTSEKFSTYEISYTKHSGKWVMSLIHSDTTRPKNYTGHLIENFPQSVLKKN